MDGVAATQRHSKYTRLVVHALPRRDQGNGRKASVFKLIVAVPSAILIGLLISKVGSLYLDRPYEHLVFDLTTPDFAVILTTQSGEPLADRKFGIKLALDPYTLYRNLPDQQTASFTIDSHGFRIDIPAALAPNTFVVGGSAAFGQGLRAGELPFAALIDQRSDVFRVANASVIGYVSGQELATIVHYLDDFDPDLYVVFDGWNDLFGPFAQIRSWPAPANLVGIQGTFFEVEKRLLASQQGSSTRASTKKESRPRTPILIGERAFFEAVTTNYVRNLEKMAAFCRARGARLVIVFQPELGHKENPSFTELGQLEYWNRAYGYVDRGFPDIYERLVETAATRCEELEIPFVNLLESATINQSEETVFLDVVHLNKTGHRMVAEEIMRQFSE